MKLDERIEGICTLAEAEGIQIELDNKGGLASVWGRLGLLDYHEDNVAQAAEYLEKALELNRELSAKGQIGENLLCLARVHLAAEDVAGAAQELREAVETLGQLQDRPGLCLALGTAAEILAARGRLREAASAAANAQHLREELRFEPPPVSRNQHEGVAREIRGQLGESVWSDIEGEALQLEPEQAAAAALEALKGIG